MKILKQVIIAVVGMLAFAALVAPIIDIDDTSGKVGYWGAFGGLVAAEGILVLTVAAYFLAACLWYPLIYPRETQQSAPPTP